MAERTKFLLSAFSDEISPGFDEQISWLSSHKVGLMEIRGVDKTPVASLEKDRVTECRKKLDSAGIGISAIGSPIGKIDIRDDFSPHLELLKKVCDYSHIFGTDRIRMFSFFMPDGESRGDYRNEVIDRLGKMTEIASSEKIVLCHENEKGIYGDTPGACAELFSNVPALSCVFDHANFISSDIEAFPYAYETLKDKILYMHIKDADRDKIMVPAGKGIGRIPETIEDLSKRGGEMILTLEPHLMEFEGLSGLEKDGHRAKLANRYSSPSAAFEVALEAVKKIINNIQ